MPKNEAAESYKEYMSRVQKEVIPCYEPSLGKEEIELLADVIKRNWLSENKYTREFESRLAAVCQRQYAVAFSNATAALITGMRSLGIGAGEALTDDRGDHLIVIDDQDHGAVGDRSDDWRRQAGQVRTLPQ